MRQTISTEAIRRYQETHGWCSIKEAKDSLKRQIMIESAMRAKTVADLRTIIIDLIEMTG